jgi:iron complex transport system substrate-binding protein
MRGRVLPALCLLAVLCAGQAAGAEHPRVASLNTCTDQLVLALADPAQILGLGPFARDPARSQAAAEAARYPRLSGAAEDVLIRKPDLVVASAFTTRATLALLKQQGLRVETFGVAASVEDAKRQIVRMGALLGQSERAAAATARIDAALARARGASAHKRYRVLAVSRRGWVAGGASLMTSLLGAVGLVNAAKELGVGSGGYVPLERIVAERPDLLLVASDSAVAEDQGRAFLLHPALERLYPRDKRLVIPEALTVCAGPTLVAALDRLREEIARVRR